MQNQKTTKKIQTSKIPLFSSPVGYIRIVVQDEKLTKLELLAAGSKKPPQDDVSKQIEIELDKYFKNPNHPFSIPFQLEGTPFQKKVWRALQQIPAGKTLTYGELAKKLKTGPRAIGQACRTNPVPIIIPCHRVVAANHLGGYSGHLYGKFSNIKKWLLEHEAHCDRA